MAAKMAPTTVPTSKNCDPAAPPTPVTVPPARVLLPHLAPGSADCYASDRNKSSVVPEWSGARKHGVPQTSSMVTCAAETGGVVAPPSTSSCRPPWRHTLDNTPLNKPGGGLPASTGWNVCSGVQDQSRAQVVRFSLQLGGQYGVKRFLQVAPSPCTHRGQAHRREHRVLRSPSNVIQHALARERGGGGGSPLTMVR